MKKIVIAIDGYSACGKSSTAKKVAKALGYSYIDTGAMYRAVTLYFLQQRVSLTNKEEILGALNNIDINFRVNKINGDSDIFLNGVNVESDIRQMEISQSVSQVSSVKEVREAMVAQQRKMGKEKGVVMDGRDIGTVVFPEAELKVFMDANLEVRAKRRQAELRLKGQQVQLTEIIENLQSRDHLDANREESPLKRAEDAILLDTTHKTLEEQVEEVVQLALIRSA